MGEAIPAPWTGGAAPGTPYTTTATGNQCAVYTWTGAADCYLASTSPRSTAFQRTSSARSGSSSCSSPCPDCTSRQCTSTTTTAATFTASAAGTRSPTSWRSTRAAFTSGQPCYTKSPTYSAHCGASKTTIDDPSPLSGCSSGAPRLCSTTTTPYASCDRLRSTSEPAYRCSSSSSCFNSSYSAADAGAATRLGGSASFAADAATAWPHAATCAAAIQSFTYPIAPTEPAWYRAEAR